MTEPLEVTAAAALARGEVAAAAWNVEAAVVHLAEAVRGFTAVGDLCRAGLASARLGDVYANGLGNLTVGRAWFARARRLVADLPPCLEQGWIALAAVGCDVDDPAELLAAARLALDRARRFRDLNLETKALADGGLALVQQGDVREGMAWLDEAMALACGAADDPDPVGKAVCSFFTACYYAADYARAASWEGALRRQGLIGSAAGTPVFLSSHCESVRAALLVELGRWSEAEEILRRAAESFEEVMQVPSWHPDLALAELRVLQGRITEAEALLSGKEQAVQALVPLAQVHRARGEHELAAVVARRGLRAIGDDRLRGIDLLTTVVEAELALGNVEAAQLACREMTRRAENVGVAPLRARVATAQARTHLASGDLPAAIEQLAGAVAELDPIELPWRRSSLLLELADWRRRSGDETGAVADARAAAAALAELDIVLSPEQRQLLNALTPATQPRGPRATLLLDGAWVEATSDGTTARLPVTKGLRYLALLIERPGQERHCLDLVDAVEGPADPGEIDRRALTDTGPMLDAAARAAYRRRVEELRERIVDATAAELHDTAERLQGELDQVVAELARAFGLGGRGRPTGSAAERARLNVTRALRAATSRLEAALPAAGPALDRSLRTGLYCAYEPRPGDVQWIVQSAPNANLRR